MLSKVWRGSLFLFFFIFGIFLSGVVSCQCGSPPSHGEGERSDIEGAGGEGRPNEKGASERDGGDTSEGGNREGEGIAEGKIPKIQCKTHCDCEQGRTCKNGVCTITKRPVYCCDKEGCPGGLPCIDLDGKEGTCSLRPVCKNHCDCKQGRDCVDGQCKYRPGKPVYCCYKLGCPLGEECLDYDRKKKTCGEVGTICQTACDCLPGLDCVRGHCASKSSERVYCCESKDNCPLGEKCQNRDGTYSRCGKKSTPCRTACDCQPGESCVGGQCKKGTEKLFCCEKTDRCPSGEKCQYSDGSFSRCPQESRSCKTHCDCYQGEFCNAGVCDTGSKPVFCCEKPCPSGELCFKRDGAVGMCGAQCGEDRQCGVPTCKQNGTDCIAILPKCRGGTCSSEQRVFKNSKCDPVSKKCKPSGGVTCRTRCDCPQGLECVGGACKKLSTLVYCCDKPGCPPSRTCKKRDGSNGRCGSSGISCTTDGDCKGKPKCRQVGRTCYASSFRCFMHQCREFWNPTNGVCQKDGTCKKVTYCQTACDCPQGYDCKKSGLPLPPPLTGICVKSAAPVYCCDNPGCPAGLACFRRDGSKGYCPGSCSSPCDCQPGEDCVGGICKRGTKPVYCCDKPSVCPAGAVCKTRQNIQKTCSAGPRSCKSPCDCLQGESCVGGRCKRGAKPVYCCDKPGCPGGQACFNKYNQSGYCPISCKTHCDCPQGQRCNRGKCVNDIIRRTYCCDKPGCPSGNFCYRRDGSFGRCPQKKCKSPCDCQPGEDCKNGVCTRSFPPVYCCTGQVCPSGQSCRHADNRWDKCKGKPQCSSACDCPQGQDCYRGQCVRVYPPVYCCDKVGCPPGQICFDKQNQRRICPGSQCKTACDCPRQGQACIRGRCASVSPPVYCCDKPGCVAGLTCEDRSGNLKTCPSKKCKTACDCSQGQDCRNGQCVRVYPPVYCCDKPGCPSRRACVKRDGSSSQCPQFCRTACDCPQGQGCTPLGYCSSAVRAYCCDKPGCPPGQDCVDRYNNKKTCPSP